MACVSRVHTVTEDVYPGRDNIIKLRLDKVSAAGARTPSDLSSVTAMELVLEGGAGTLHVDFEEADASINWWADLLSVGEVMFQLGHWVESESVPAGSYACELVVFDPLYQSGTVWVSGSTRELVIKIH